MHFFERFNLYDNLAEFEEPYLSVIVNGILEGILDKNIKQKAWEAHVCIASGAMAREIDQFIIKKILENSK